MKLETAKSFLLTILVGVSLLLTFGLWSSQPNSAQLNNAQLLNEVDLGGEDESKRSLIEPRKIIFHSNESHYGFENPKDRKKLYEDMQSWVLYNFTTGGATNRSSSNQTVEVIFPDAIPMEVVSILFTLNEEVELPNWSFEQVYFEFSQETQSLEVQFISIDGRRQANAVINDSVNYHQLWSIMSSLDGLTEYTLLGKSESAIYIPLEKPNLKRHSIPVNSIDPRLMVDALFANPSVVSLSNSPNRGGPYYTDSQRELSVNENRTSLEYFNPVSDDFEPMSTVNLLDRSIQSINDHKGWLEEYNLLNIEPALNKIEYQMFYEGFPVFNNSGLSTMTQEWRNQELFRYQRPLFRLSNSAGSGSETVDVSSGGDIAYNLRDEFDNDSGVEHIRDIELGYRLTYQSNDLNDYITLDPAWYMNYNGTWQEIKFEEFSPVEGRD
ncbi:two-component system activity regulator YycH [Virgibacillus sp. C22-A2]|uniref:Two-component system activity regulator YycH n=1 Tax=Virgibacillus tibetensis TaxID=3042313 RepID=A0ABU6KL03_9BACI|nr:two-component system activity regulator YycH [Virgibacillus sp. C22-A2]